MGHQDIATVKASDTPSWNSGGTKNALPEERAKASFDVETMTRFIDGGLKETLRRRWIMESSEKINDVGGTSARFDLDRIAKKGAIASNFKHFMDIHKEHLDRFMIPKGNDFLYMTMGQTMGGYPGFGLFLATMVGQASQEQLSWWLPRVYTMGITGAYAQTELGHGSNVRGLETTAHYDKATGEFVLNTPTLTSIKWWPSSLTTATHCVLYAQLIIDGKEYGLHVFMVQVRDENLKPLPGIEVGDLGTKLGENEVDIGYLRLKSVRVPRKHMMEKRQYVTPDGKYVKIANEEGGARNEKAAYLTMMTARVQMVGGSSVFLAKAATIAIRYNAVRRQGFVESSKQQSYKSEELKIIDYKMNQYLLLRELARAFAIRFTSNWLTERMEQIQQNPDDADDLPDMHATSAGLKGYCCYATSLGIEELRKTCGGAGYLMASGIAALSTDYTWRATAEGSTVPMLLQTAKYLMKSVQDAENGKSLSGLASVFAVLQEPNFSLEKNHPKRARAVEDFLSIDYLIDLFKYRTILQSKLTKSALDRKLNTGIPYDTAWSELTSKATKTGQSHVLFFLLSRFAQVIATCQDDKCRKVLQDLCILFALSDIMDGNHWMGILTLEEYELAESAVDIVCSKLRPEAVCLVDSWDFHDKALNSSIGNYAGDVYEQQYLAAATAPINEHEVPEFMEAIKPYLDMDFLKLRNGLVEGVDANDMSAYPATISKL